MQAQNKHYEVIKAYRRKRRGAPKELPSTIPMDVPEPEVKGPDALPSLIIVGSVITLLAIVYWRVSVMFIAAYGIVKLYRYLRSYKTIVVRDGQSTKILLLKSVPVEAKA